MEPYDYQIVFGVILGALSIVGLASALVERRASRGALLGLAVSLGLLAWAWVLAGEGGLEWRDVPMAFLRVIAAWT